MRAPAVLLAVPFLTGAAAAIVFADRLDARFPFISAAASLSLLVAATGAALQDDVVESACAVVGGCLFSGLALGADASRDAYAPPLLQWFDAALPTEPVILEGILREDASLTHYGVSLTIDVTHVKSGASTRAARPGPLNDGSMGGVRMSVAGAFVASRAAQWRAGRVIRAPVFLRRPATYFNPGSTDERRALARRGIVLVGSIKSAALVEVVRRGGIIGECAGALRDWVRGRLAREIAGVEARDGGAGDPGERARGRSTSAGVATAVLIGDRGGLNAEDERRLQDAGTYHVIAISGGNIAVLTVLALFVCRGFLMSPRMAAAATGTALVFYGIVAGGTPSVTRAVTVAILLLSSRALDQRGPSLNALAVAAVLFVAAAPVVILDAGFILSFGATLGILLGVPRLVVQTAARPKSPLLRAARHLRFILAALLAATVCAEAALVPIGATLFGRVPVGGLLLNFVAIPLMTIVQVGSLVLLVGSVLSPWLVLVAGAAVHLAATGLLGSARLVDVAPWLTIGVAPPAFWLSSFYYACVFGLLLTHARRGFSLALALIAVVMFTGPTFATRDAVPSAPVPLRLVIFDVGQGDASAVVLPAGRSILVDSGGLAAFSSPDELETSPAFDIGERVLAPALRALGVTRLDSLVVSHGDPDHLGGAAGILRRVPLRSVWEGIPVPRHSGLRTLAALARSRDVSWRTVQAGDSERFGGIELRVLHPPLPDWERQRVRNEDSVVIEVRIKDVSVILPGDIGREGEAAILSTLEPGRLVVLKAPHHGSVTSSTPGLLERLKPAAVVFSCGRDNRFGHPHPTVVERYKAVGARIFSTAEHGAVFVESDGANIHVYGWRQAGEDPLRIGASRMRD